MYGTERFGFTVYGNNPLHPDRQPRTKRISTGREKDMSLVFGAGPALKNSHDAGYDWDIKLGPDGDFMYREGWDFLGQELAFQAAFEGYQIIGEPISQTTLSKTEKRLTKIWEKDSRIRSVDNVSATPDDDRTDTVSIAAALTSEEGDYNELEFR